jgi:imidazolonepropionase
LTLRVLPGGAEAPAPGLLIRGAAEVVTMAGGLRVGSAQDDVAALSDDRAADPTGRLAPAVAAWEGRILAVGALPDVMQRIRGLGLDEKRFATLDARGGTVTPGLIDPHTHLLFAGTREAEVRLRQQGAGYIEILTAGGGILSTVTRTRAASNETLHAHGRRWLDEMLGHGVTTIEAKSGYGLDTTTELRLLDIAARLGAEGPIEIVPTYLGAHAVPPEYSGRRAGAEAYVADVVERQLPAVEAQGVARFCDVFCERGVFSVEQSRRVLEAGRRHGLALRLHADELVPSGGAQLAAAVGAVSADHLAAPSREGIAALVTAAGSEQPVVATLLPATSLVLMKEHDAPARVLIDRGVPVALGSDFNPGTSPTPNLQIVLSLAVLRLHMTPSEALAAVTVNAAHAIGLGETHGTLDEGHMADLVIWDVPSHELLPYWLGADLARVVVKGGRVVLARS